MFPLGAHAYSPTSIPFSLPRSVTLSMLTGMTWYLPPFPLSFSSSFETVAIHLFTVWLCGAFLGTLIDIGASSSRGLYRNSTITALSRSTFLSSSLKCYLLISAVSKIFWIIVIWYHHLLNICTIIVLLFNVCVWWCIPSHIQYRIYRYIKNIACYKI